MRSTGKLLLYIQDDDSIYRLLLLGLALSSPALHYLCFDHIYDPLLLRGLCSIICLIAISFSFSSKIRKTYVGFRYISMCLYLGVNNGLLLGANDFASVYLFSSITVFIALTLFCRTAKGFIRLSLLNLAAITAAYSFDSRRAISLPALIMLLITFTLIAYVSFLVRILLKYRLNKAVEDVTELNNALKDNEQRLMEAHLIARIGDWWFDIDARELSWSASIYTILETDYVPDQKNHFSYYLSLIYPEDRKSALTYFLNIKGSQTADLEHRLITPKGNLKYIRVRIGNPLKNSEGDIKRISGVIQDITELKLTERIIKKSQADLMEAQSIARIGNWKWNLMHNRFSWSDEIYRIYNIPPKKSAGSQSVRQLLKSTHPDDKPLLFNLFKFPEKIDQTSYEYRIITPDKKIKYLSLIIGKVMRNENGSLKRLIGTIQDITDRKIAQINHQQIRDKYKLVLETINLLALSLDPAGNIIFCNKYIAKLLGYAQDELIGLNWYEHFVDADLAAEFSRWFKNSAVEAEFVNPIICRNGEKRIIRWQNSVIYDENGSIKELTSIGEDITAEQIDRQNLISAKELAEQSSRFKSEFLSIMSHEIRTPMNAVIGTTNLLISENPKPEQMQYLNALKFSGENLLAIINDILDYNRIEVGKMELSHIAFNIHELIKNIQQVFYPKAAEKSLVITVTDDLTISDALIGDPVRLSQILSNLVGNALKFTHVGSINIKLQKIAETNGTQTIDFKITDTGIGIDRKNLKRIFDPFTQETESTHNHYGGSGLGLAITQKLVELHNSHIEVQSELGKGTSFNFHISFQTAQAATAAQAAGCSLNEDINLKDMRVLVVDDNQMNLMVASRFLKKWNVESETALNGKIAVEMALQKNFDLIIMDLQMPVMDGFEATAIIKQTYPQMPVIALTADAMPETYEKALAAGMNDLLTKPFKPDDFFQKVSKFRKKATLRD